MSDSIGTSTPKRKINQISLQGSSSCPSTTPSFNVVEPSSGNNTKYETTFDSSVFLNSSSVKKGKNINTKPSSSSSNSSSLVPPCSSSSSWSTSSTSSSTTTARQPNSSHKNSSSRMESNTNNNEPVYLMTLIDNRAKEVGMAVMNLKSTHIIMSQFVETSTTTFHNVCNMIQVYSPCVEVVLPKTLADSTLASTIKREYPGVQLSFIPRKLFNEAKGQVITKQLAVKSASSIDAEISRKYLCVSATAALIDYVEYIQNITFASQSIKFMYKQLSGHLLIDSSSIMNLELVMNMKTGKSDQTLFSVMNHTKTPMGSRMLRSSLLQPLTDIATINTRLDCVDELLKKEQEFFNLSTFLNGFLDLDHLLYQFCQVSKKATPKSGQTVIMNILCMKRALEQILDVEAVVREYENPLLLAIATNLQHEDLLAISDEIDRMIEPNVTLSKNPQKMQTQKVYAIKAGINGLLDVARRQYLDMIEGMNSTVNGYKEQTGISSLKLLYNVRRGYYLSFDAKTTLSPESKRLFIQLTKQSRKIVCSTEELNSINQKIRDIMEEIYLLTDTVVDELVDATRQKLDTLYKVSESIALLDLLFSFASLVTVSNQYVRPEFSSDGPIAIKSGRHPILEKNGARNFFVPNDTYLTDSSNFQILTGANMSGKSTHIRQVALISIMAHIGCYVPAQFASFRLIDKLFTRIGTDDSLETNSSTFMVEMKEISYIIQNVTDRSLILIDELGRGTSNIEGNSIAWSICEYLLSSRAYTVFVTHYMQLVELELLYPSVKNYHCMVSTTEGKLDFMYSVGAGSCNEDRYGIKLAKMLGLPREITCKADEICHKVTLERKRKLEMSEQASKQNKTQDLRSCYQLATRLMCLKLSTLSSRDLTTHLSALKENSKELLEKFCQEEN